MQSVNGKNHPRLASYVTYNWCSTSLDYMTDYEKNFKKYTGRISNGFISIYISGKPYVAGMVINPDHE